MPILPKPMCIFNAIHIKLSMAFFTEIERPILMFTWKYKISQKPIVTLRKMRKAGGITIVDFEPYYKVITIQKHDNDTKRDMNNKGIEEPDTNSHHCSHLSFEKGVQIIH
jgi:hypothetical protein